MLTSKVKSPDTLGLLRTVLQMELSNAEGAKEFDAMHLLNDDFLNDCLHM